MKDGMEESDVEVSLAPRQVPIDADPNKNCSSDERPVRDVTFLKTNLT